MRTLRHQYERDFAYLELRSGRLFCEPKFISILPKFEPDIRPSDKILPPSAILEFLPSLRMILIYSGEILLLLEILPIAHCGLQDFALVTLALGGGKAESRLKRHSGAKFPRLSVKSLLIAKYGGFKLAILRLDKFRRRRLGFKLL